MKTNKKHLNTLIILNYQREIPPFMQTEVLFAKDTFDIVYYVTPKLHNNNSESIKYNNVTIIQSQGIIRIYSFFKAIISFLKTTTLFQLRLALNKKKFSISIFKHIGSINYASDILFRAADNIMKKRIDSDSIYILATWFSTEAHTAARLKIKYPSTKTISYAHAFEINPEVNKFFDISYNRFKHENIDLVSFISSKKRDQYFSKMDECFIKYFAKTNIRYLGSTKDDKHLNNSVSHDFNICSCSGIVKVKRIHLLLQSLMYWDLGLITLTHIGSGPLEDEIKVIANDVMKANKNVKIIFLGKLTNKDVKKYYATNPVDLFINVSESEGIPVSIMEAMSYGIPVIATDVGGTSEIVNSATGILIVKDSTPQCICTKIKEYYMLPNDLKKRYRNNAYNMWKQNFNANKNRKEFFNEIIA